MPPSPAITDRLLRIRGTVQGVGFRPFVHRAATALNLRGWVRNDAAGVVIRVCGEADAIDALVTTLRTAAPPAARVDDVATTDPAEGDLPVGGDFAIAPSDLRAGPRSTAIPADLALCADCRRELLDPADRRHRYPFLNCTQCGPRYSIIESLPYDRPRTTMRAFRQCPECRREYDSPENRRFHAEPNACPACGPQLSLTRDDGTIIAPADEAIAQAVIALDAGQILAVKGLGGFHLMTDATREGTVARLRARKHRDAKPLAVMFPDLATLAACAEVSAAAEALLTSPQAPIVLVPRRTGGPLADGLAPGNPWIGALLPYTPLHLLLLQAVGRPLVATSANLSDEPLCTDNAEARLRLRGIADLHLVHDRPIARPVDDSVVRLTGDERPLLLRRARGHAPAPLRLPAALPAPILCTGADLKNTVAVAGGDRVMLSPHIGDLEVAATQQLFERTIAMLGQLTATAPALVVHDRHPDYASTRYALRQPGPHLAVQHHLAHVLACLLEHGQAPDDVLGVAWDGTGYGEDGTVWGGEFILLRQGRAERFARIRPFSLPGGEAAVRDARRVAFALAQEISLGDQFAARALLPAKDAALLATMIARSLNSPRCSSAGRLFDGVGALLGLGQRNAFESQVPLAVEAAAFRNAGPAGGWSFPLRRSATPGARLEVDWEPAVAELLSARPDASAGAAAFHRGLAEAIVAVAREAGVGTVALSGGCFQNALLATLTADALAAAGFRVLTHRLLSPNDNSIAAGQALAALLNLHTVDLSG